MPAMAAISPQSRLLVPLLAAATVSASLSIDLCLPALPAIAESLATDMGRVQQTLSVFILGVGFSQLLYGPLADSFGRKPILMASLALFCLASLMCAMAGSVEQLIAFRLLQALGAAAGAVVTRAIVRDLYRGEKAARIFSQVMLVMLVVPLIAPLVSAQLLHWFSWRIIFILLATFGFSMIFSVGFQLPETLPAQERRRLRLKRLPRQYLGVLKNRAAAGYFLCGSFTFAGMFAFVTAAPFVYIQYFGVPVEYFGLWYGSNILMVTALSWFNGRVIERVGLGPMLRHATILSMLAGCAVLFFAVTGLGGLWGIFPGLVVFIGSLGLIGANCNAGMLEPFGKSAGTASAMMGAGRFLFGGVASMMVGFFHDGTPTPMALLICACSVLSWISYRYFVVPGSDGRTALSFSK
jgi:DHA1 family bicyclomycin/chloramphenicol resistance-like MFS transporter